METKILRDKLVTKRKEMNLKITVRNLSEIQLRIPEKHDMKEPLRERQQIKASNVHVTGVSKEENGGNNIQNIPERIKETCVLRLELQ